MTVGERVKKARKARGMTQRQLADACGVFVNTISYWETGRFEPTWYTMVRVAEVLNVSLDWFAGRMKR